MVVEKVVGKKGYFANNASRGILTEVGQFGEILCSEILGAEIVSGTQEYEFADLFNSKHQAAFQVKMCNGRHAQRPLPPQIARLHEEVQGSFLARHGAYVLVFYYGIIQKHNKICSLIKSKNLGVMARTGVLARELQYIYIVDVNLLQHLVSNYPEMIHQKSVVVHPDQTKTRQSALYINRVFLKGFVSRLPLQRHLLREACGPRARVTSYLKAVHFKGAERFRKDLPVHVIGNNKMVEMTKAVIQRRKHFYVNFSGFSGQKRLGLKPARILAPAFYFN